MKKPARNSLQEAMRARREATPLLSPAELRKRETERLRAEADAAASSMAARLVERWRAKGTAVDARAVLDAAAYRAVFALEPVAYEESGHWARVEAAQLELAPACEVARCGSREDLHAHRLTGRSIGEEQPGTDLVTLCDGCRRRAAKLARAQGRPLTREQIRGVDPRARLYGPDEIAALKRKHAKPPRKPRG